MAPLSPCLLLFSGASAITLSNFAETPAKAPAETPCAQGKTLPRLYVLGAKNTATSSMYTNLHQCGVEAAPDDHTKEWQFFANIKPGRAKMHKEWIDALPACQPGLVLADFSVMNLPSIQLPTFLSWAPETGYGIKKGFHAEEWDTPQRIHNYYAKTSQPQFIVQLREPLERMHSEYYHTLPLHNCLACQAGENFTAALNLSLDAFEQHQVDDWNWKSMYAVQLETWLQTFEPRLFAFVPFREYVSFNPGKFSRDLLAWLHLDGAKPWDEAAHSNEHFWRPPLDEELPRDSPLRLRFEKDFEPETKRLVEVLASAQLRGAWLPGCEGTPGDRAAVRAWLLKGW